ncbi:helix-turn-helix domain-containing protein [Fictibacillus gelatini]|uniref:helix-turn-helix domain-containing protein n=1 Tax=Fictibacillus gelatini TaxID=225985 RepID=UPI0004006422|nr:XRE family transcriptional regulator [Fictibacillus gelatini]
MNLNQVIGKKLKQLRKERKWSLEETATMTEVSKPMLSQIERGESNPTVSTLWKIANGFGVPFTTFLENDEPVIKIVDRDDVDSLKENNGKYIVRPLYPMEGGKPLEIYSVELKSGCHYVSSPHPGGVEEYLIVEEGSLNVIVNENTYTLCKGQSIRFSGDYEHIYENTSDSTCFVTMIMYYGKK